MTPVDRENLAEQLAEYYTESADQKTLERYYYDEQYNYCMSLTDQAFYTLREKAELDD